MFGTWLPTLKTEVPGKQSREWIDRLSARECPAITARRARRAQALGAADDDPIVWDAARGANVRDVDGNVFVDMTAGFGVMSVGYADPAVVAAGQQQMGRLGHAMGDAFPDRSRIELLERLAAISALERAILGCSGSDAVEAALKTARMATGNDTVVAFEGGYHGLSHGALAVTGYKKQAFREPFVGQLSPRVRFEPFGSLPDLVGVGAVIVEVVQGRGGVRPAPDGWLAELSTRARTAGAVVIADEIFTGLRRTGPWLASHEQEGFSPDLVCVGKSLGGGFPVSACLGTAAAMDAWGASRGEAIHTQTFLGNPVGCAMALATLDRLESLGPDARALAGHLEAGLEALGLSWRGRGLMMGVLLDDPLAVSRALLKRGYIALPAGEDGEVLSLSPPFVLTLEQADGFLGALSEIL